MEDRKNVQLLGCGPASLLPRLLIIHKREDLACSKAPLQLFWQNLDDFRCCVVTERNKNTMLIRLRSKIKKNNWLPVENLLVKKDGSTMTGWLADWPTSRSGRLLLSVKIRVTSAMFVAIRLFYKLFSWVAYTLLFTNGPASNGMIFFFLEK